MRLIFVLLFSVVFFSAGAQQIIFEKYTGWDGGYVTLASFQNKTQSCILTLGADSVKAFLSKGIDSIEESFTVPRFFNENFLGGFIKNNKVYLFMDNAGKPGIRCWLYDMAERKAVEHQISLAIKNSRIISRLSSDSHFFYFTYNKKSEEFVIYRFSNEKKYDTIRYADKTALWEKITTEELFSTAIDIQRVDMAGECPAAIARRKSKIYVSNDSLLLIVNNSATKTLIYSFDILNGIFSNRSINHATASNYPVPEVYNSFLLDGKLYFCSASSEALCIKIIDFYSGNAIKEFYATEGKGISFLNTDIGSSTTDDIESAEGKTGNFLKEMSKGDAVIIAQPLYKDTCVILTIASFRERYGSGMWALAGPVASGVHSFGMAWKGARRFKTRIGTKDFNHVPGILPTLINEKIDEYARDFDVNFNGQILYSLNGNYYFSFYNKRERTINVAMFIK